MKLYIKQHFFSWIDRFTVYDENGNDKFFVQSKSFSFGKKLHIYDRDENELAYIEQRLLTFLPKYNIYRDGFYVAEVIKEIAFLGRKYTVNGLDWEVDGDFFAHDYEIGTPEGSVTVSKEWFSLGDAYEIDIDDGIDEINALAVALVIYACISRES